MNPASPTNVSVSHQNTAQTPRTALLNVLQSRLHLDTDVVDIIVAVALGVYAPGEPLWLFLVDAPGAGKTELIRAFRGHARVHSEDKLTPHRLITGLRDAHAADLFPELDGKLLTVKDFTLTLQMRDADRNEVLADLRGAYDGYLEKGFGSGAGDKGYKSYQLQRPFGFLAGVTPVIDHYRVVTSVLGERFLKLRMGTDPHQATCAAVRSAGLENITRSTVGKRMHHALDYYGLRVKPISRADTALKNRIAALAELGAKLRSQVMRNRRGELDYAPLPEVGTRLGKVLMRLAETLTTFHDVEQAGENEYRLLTRVIADSLPTQRARLVPILRSRWVATAMAAAEARLPVSTVGQALEDLYALSLVGRRQSGHSYEWTLTDDVLGLIELSGLFKHANQGV